MGSELVALMHALVAALGGLEDAQV